MAVRANFALAFADIFLKNVLCFYHTKVFLRFLSENANFM